MRRVCSRRVTVTLVFLAVTAWSTTATAAQEAPVRFGFGYAANAPEMMLGASGMVVLPALGGIGLYVDAKFNRDNPGRTDEFLPGRTALEVEDEVPGVQFRDSKDSYQGFNAALVKQFNPSLLMYVGAGVSTMTRYREYRDPAEELGLAGLFWVEAPDEEATSMNVMVGAFFRVSPLVVMQTGFETQPKGFTVGASFVFPRQEPTTTPRR